MAAGKCVSSVVNTTGSPGKKKENYIYKKNILDWFLIS